MNLIRVLKLLLNKNFLVRKREWKKALIAEIIIPVLLFLMIQTGRHFGGDQPVKIPNDTYYKIIPKQEILKNLNLQTQIFFAPKNDFTSAMMDTILSCLKFRKENGVGFATEEDLLEEYAKRRQDDLIVSSHIGAIIFDKAMTNSSQNLVYTVRVPFFLDFPYSIEFVENYNVYNFYTKTTFLLPLQICIDESFILLKSSKLTTDAQISLQQVPYPPHVQGTTTNEYLGIMVAVIAVFSFAIPLCIESGYFADEKYIGINVLMNMNNVSTFLNLLSWLITGLIVSIFYITAIIFSFKMSFSSHTNPFLYYGNSFIFWLALACHISHLLAFGMHISTYFSRSVFMQFGLIFLYICGSMIHYHMTTARYHSRISYLGILFPNVLLFRMFQEVTAYEGLLIGNHFSNIFQVADPQYKAFGSLGALIILSLLGTVIHLLMAVYICAVHPGKYGVKQHPLFFLKYIKGQNKVDTDDEIRDFEYDVRDGGAFETVDSGALNSGIQIRNLKKTYQKSLFSSSEVHALKGISVDFYQGQITALLGHNGAGKTTMMSILTTMISPTSGSVFINGKSIITDSEEIINNIGLCPQENILFPKLTVQQQLIFFGKLKNRDISSLTVETQVSSLLKKLGIFEKRGALPHQLSGGQKRRVCLGMSMISDSEIIILDEPTSGMDPESRRDTWDILLKMRGQKTILISTHDMEEADILGDRIAIIHKGQLKSYGTPMFLKKNLGEGNLEITLSTKSSCDPQRVLNELNPNGKITNIDGGKVVLSIPYTPELPDALDNLEKKKDELGVTGMSVSLITLEQVFLKITKDSDDTTDTVRTSLASLPKSEGNALMLQTLLALIKKKFKYLLKNKMTIFFIMFLPLIFIFLKFLDSKAIIDQNTWKINLDLYKNPEVFLTSYDDTISNAYKLWAEKFHGNVHKFSGSDINHELLKFSKTDLTTYRNNLIAAAEFNYSSSNIYYANALYSDLTSYSIPISLNLLTNAILKKEAGEKHSITFTVRKFPQTISARQLEVEASATTLGDVFFFMLFYFPTIALFVIHPLKETLSKIKQLQMMTSKVSYFTYWGTIFLVDILICLSAIFVIALGFIYLDKATDMKMYYVTETSILVIIFILFSMSVLPLVYAFSFQNKPVNAVVRILIQIPVGLVIVELIMLFLEIAFKDNSIFDKVRFLQKYSFLFIPYISFFRGLISFWSNAAQNARCRKMDESIRIIACFNPLYKDKCCALNCHNGECEKSFSYWEPDGLFEISLKQCLVFLFVSCIVYFVILFVIEQKYIQLLIMRYWRNDYEPIETQHDEQVKQEKDRVAMEISKIRRIEALEGISSPHGDSNYSFMVYELSKRYDNKFAVEEISFGVCPRECFGLLGVNGAGKSTTFRMITGDEIPEQGLMCLDGFFLDNDRKPYLSQMGYCPQTDAIIRSLNAYDHLELFAYLRGIPKDQVHTEVKEWIDKLDLNACALQPSGTYSGGNKRRLNIAIALIGNPKLVLLDEPTTGVDPAARRSLWNTIKSCQTSGQAIILTSHSMEECEALCNRLVIMVGGKLVCVGPCQELKQRFGAGFDIQIKLNPRITNNDLESIKNYIHQNLDCELIDENQAFLMFHVTNVKTSWRKMYDVMSELKNNYSSIDDFSVLSSSLEQLFLLFARGARK